MKKNESKNFLKPSPSQPFIKEMNKSTDMITSLIHEYLLKREYYKTLDLYQEEISQKIKQKTYYKAAFLDITESNLLKTFSLGRKNDFFKIWNRIIPNHIRLREPPIQKIEFYIQIYFAIYPSLYKDSRINCNKTMQETMNEFKIFLEKKEYELNKTSEFLSYYALPYINNPQTHPSYMKLFSPEWSNELKDKIRQSVKTYLPSIKYPVIYDLVTNDAALIGNNNNVNVSNISQGKIDMMKTYLESLSQGNNNNIINSDDAGNFNNNNNNNSTFNINSGNNFNYDKSFESDELIQLREENERLKKKEEKNKSHFISSQKSWTNLALNILSYSFDLVMLCKSNKNYNEVLLKSDKINKKLMKFQSFLNKNLEDLEKAKVNVNNTFLSGIRERNDEMENIANSNYDDLSNINNNSMINNSGLQNRSFHVEYDHTHLIDINLFQNTIYNNIKNKNLSSDDDLKYSFVFREMRLRSFRRTDPGLKKLTLYSIFFYDLYFKFNLLKEIILNPQIYEKSSLEIMKLLNQIASLKKGRNYLLMRQNSNQMIEDIVHCMMNEKEDSELRQNCLGTIQKFTLRIEPQNKLIELGIIKWLIETFTYESKALSDYSIEYGLALILNLALKKNGREKFEEESERTIQILINYINKDNIQIQTCVNGTLYSLIKRPLLREAAKKFGVENIIKNTQIKDPQTQKQMTYILEELQSNNNNINNDDNIEENFEEDPNAIDDENENNNFDEEYAELDSIDEDLVKLHYKNIGEFLIRNENQNVEEEQKIEVFSQKNPNMLNIDLKISNDNNDNLNYIEGEEKKEGKFVVGLNDKSREENNNNNNNEKEDPLALYQKDITIEQAFEKHDRILRTPPNEYK